MTTSKISILLASCLLGTTAFAQEPMTRDAKPARAPQAAERGKQRPVLLPHTEVLRQAVWAKAGEETVDLGMVANLVVDSSNGTVSHVVIKSGEKSAEPGMLRAIPYSDLGWSMNEGGKPQAMLTMEARAFDALPKFDPKSLDKMTGKGAMDAAAKRVDKATEGMSAEEKAEAVKTARGAMEAPGRSVLLTSMANLGVFAPSEREAFGKATVFDVNVTGGRVAFAEVNVADTDYLVPFQVLKVRSTPGADGAKPTLSLVAPTNAEGMAGAPTIDKAKEMTAMNPRFVKSVNEHYGVKPMGGKMRGEGMKHDGDKMKKGMKKKAGEVKEAGRKIKDGVKEVVDKN